jgi:hypothetical protein
MAKYSSVGEVVAERWAKATEWKASSLVTLQVPGGRGPYFLLF